MQRGITEKLRNRIIKNFLDILIITEIKNRPLCGYDIINHINQKYNLFVSAGTVYSLLYSLEREGLITGVQGRRKRIYTLTEKGEGDASVITKANGEIQAFLRNMFVLS